MYEEQLAELDKSSIPLYSLYGQIDSAAELQFLHLETLESRNRFYDWNIRPHRHHDLHQIVWVEDGGGNVILDDKRLEPAGPVLINIPPSTVHGFQWRPGAQGFVLTISESFMTDLFGQTADPAIEMSLGQVLVVTQYGAQSVAKLTMLFASLMDEYTHERLGRATTVSGYVLVLLAEITRLRQLSQREVLAAHMYGGELYHGFKELVEAHFRDHWSVAAYAKALRVTDRSLRRLSLKFSDQTPVQIIHRRLLLEAKRNLLYTEKSIAAVGYVLGFDDPAYFTRFFIKNAGETPLQFRRGRMGATAG